ncbi:MAG: hypothetical protein H8E54_06535 [Candidatus Aminicenantes bacterium]|nr:hypothetical protein [Candidatus Aminicenantes bacterium]
MKKIIGIVALAVLAVLVGVVFVVGRGPKPQYPYIHSGPEKSDPKSLIEKQNLIKDIDYYVALIDSAHGDPYRQVPKESFIEKAEELKDLIRLLQDDKISLIRCYYYLQELAAFLQDEHTSIIFSDNWRKTVGKRFPLIIRIFKEKVYVLEDLSQAAIPQYAELISIDDKPLKEIMSETRKFVNVTLPHYKWQIAERNFDKWLQTYFNLRPPWNVTYRIDNKEKTVEVAGISSEEFPEKTKKDELYSESLFRVGVETIPLLEIPKFFYPDRSAYNKFMDDFFQKHKDKSYMVIDLRHNPGGDGRWGRFVLDYFMESPYLTTKRFDFKISKEFSDIVWYYQHLTYYNKKIPRLLWWLPWLKSIEDDYWLDKVLQAKIGEYAEEHSTYHDPDPNKVKFKGKTYLLVSHYTNSAAVVFSAIFKHQKLGTIVGQETGGRETFTSDPITIQMPNSPLRAVIPVAILALPGKNPDRGVLPDIEVEYTFEDYISNRDLDLEKVKTLIHKDISEDSN